MLHQAQQMYDCAVVEHADGRRTHHTNVQRCGLCLRRGRGSAVLTFRSGEQQIIDGANAVYMTDRLEAMPLEIRM